MFSVKGQIVSIFDFMGHTVLVSVATTQLSHCRAKAAIDNTYGLGVAMFP